MARPYKSGLDYFPLDVDFFEDEKITAIFIEFGVVGEIIAIRLLCAIYRNGYFAKWDTPIKMKISKSSGIKPDLIEEIVRHLVKWNFFNAEMFENFGILTSVGIQKRYLESTKRRAGSIGDYCLLKSHSDRVNDNNNPVNDNNNPEKYDNNPQSKVKKSKVNNKERELGDSNIESADSRTSIIPSPAFFTEFELKFPEVDHQREFDRCYSYYKAHGKQILDWDECYKIWLSKPYDKAQKKKESQVQAYIIPLRDDLKEIKTDSVHTCSHCGQKSVSVSDNGKDKITGFYCQHCGTFDIVEVENIKEINDV